MNSENEKLREALRKIVERCEIFMDEDADMRTHSVYVIMGIAGDALSQQAEPAPAQDERDAVYRDAELYGIGFMVDGVRVHPSRVTVQYSATRTAQNEQQPEQSDIVLNPEAQKVLAECIGAHAYVVGAITNGREDLALAEASKWVEAFREASAALAAQGGE